MAANATTKNLSPALYSLRYADIDDDNAIKTAIATVAADTTYTAGDLNGVMASPGPALTKMHRLTVTTSASAGTYTIVRPLIFTCTDQRGNERLLYRTLTAVGGGEVLEFAALDGTDQGALTVVSIFIPEMNDASGSLEFGVSDVVFDEPCRQVRGGGGGKPGLPLFIGVEYQSLLDSTDNTTIIGDVLVCIEGERHDCFVKRILDTGTTAFPVTAYI